MGMDFLGVSVTRVEFVSYVHLNDHQLVTLLTIVLLCQTRGTGIHNKYQNDKRVSLIAHYCSYDTCLLPA